MTRLLQFGDSPSYDFTQAGLYVETLSDNFGDAVPKTVRVPGADGGVDQYGSRPAPLEIGNVSATLTLVSPTLAGMDALRRDVRKMVAWGVQKLYRTVDYLDTPQWCYARVNSNSVALNEADYTDIFQPVSIQWQVASPGWLAQGTTAYLWGGGATWGGGAAWGGAGGSTVVSGTQTDFTEAVDGSLRAYPQLVLTSTGTCTNPVIQRLEAGAVVDEVAYTGTLSSGDQLIVNTAARTVTVNGSNVYNDFDYRRGGWFSLEPGDNSIRVNLDDAGNSGTLALKYNTRYI